MSDSQTISLQDGADRLGVHYMTIYRYVRLGLLPAHKEGGTWRVRIADLEEFQHPSDSTPRHHTGHGEAPWSDRLEARMLAGDAAGAWSVVEAALSSGSEPDGIYADMLAPALRAIGEKWVSGEISVGDEHLASAVASRIIGRLGPRFARRGRSRGTVITVMPPGDRHGFGLSMLADVLRGAGYGVMDLGPDTPVASAVTAVEKAERLVAVCVSVVFDEALAGVVEMVSAIRAAVGDVPVIVGGRAVQSESHALELGADGWAITPAEAVELVSRLSGGRAAAGGAAR